MGEARTRLRPANRPCALEANSVRTALMYGTPGRDGECCWDGPIRQAPIIMAIHAEASDLSVGDTRRARHRRAAASRDDRQDDSFAAASIAGCLPFAVSPLARLIPRGSRQVCGDTRIMAIHEEASDLSVAATEFRATLGALGIAQHRVAQLFGVGPRSVRRWQDGDRRVPCGVGIVLRLLAAGTVTVAQVEQAAVPIPARTNGSAKPGPPAPLLVAPAPEQSATAPAEAAALADPGLTTAEKVVALAPGDCRWPHGDPGHPDFHFCGSPVARKPYCEQHRAMAYAAPLTGSGHGAAAGASLMGGDRRPRSGCQQECQQECPRTPLAGLLTVS